MFATTLEHDMKILVAIDDSDDAQLVLREIPRRPWPAPSEFRVLCVMASDPAKAPPTVPVPSAPLSEVPAWPVGTLRVRETLDALAMRTAQRGADALTAAGLPATAIIREGAPGPEIIAEARECRADLIIVGSRRRGLVARILLGSVATYVLHHAACSIEVVREPHYD
jgi:nucleotide-binding universal stress UspA family protein